MQNDLTDRLRDEHKQIMDALMDAKDICISTSEGQKRLMAVKDILLEHLDREDRELYAKLKSAAYRDPRLKTTLDFFLSDIEEVSEIAHDFFERYREGCTGLDFIQDFGTFFIMLRNRMTKEENVLFHEYERLAG